MTNHLATSTAAAHAGHGLVRLRICTLAKMRPNPAAQRATETRICDSDVGSQHESLTSEVLVDPLYR